MLNHHGLSKLGEGNEVFTIVVKRKTREDLKQRPMDLPVILMFDNINMYRGKHKHLRLFKYLGPTMWNLTGKAVINQSSKTIMSPSDLKRVHSSLIQMTFSSRLAKERLMYLEKLLMHFCWNLLMIP